MYETTPYIKEANSVYPGKSNSIILLEEFVALVFNKLITFLLASNPYRQVALISDDIFEFAIRILNILLWG